MGLMQGGAYSGILIFLLVNYFFDATHTRNTKLFKGQENFR